MTISVGIGLAFVAMLCWGIGDFLIQRSTRKIGDVETLFLITLFGALVLVPFVYDDIPAFLSGTVSTVWVVLGGSLILFIAALLEFEALRRGKISVVEPMWSLEIIAAALFAFLILGEGLSPIEITLGISLIVGLSLVSFRGKVLSHRHLLERGVLIGLLSAVFMGVANFFVGWGARLTDALLMNFVLNVVITVLSGAYLVFSGRLMRTFRDLARYRASLIPMMVTDNAAWVAYAFAMTLIPIAIATALSESYIVIAVILGLAVGHERLEFHQRVGLACAIAAAVALAALTA